MSMPVILNIVDTRVKDDDFESIFQYLRTIDRQFSTFNDESETTKINRGESNIENYSPEMRKVIALGRQTKSETNGYFDIYSEGKLDPAGIVKGLAIYEATRKLQNMGYHNFYLEIAGDVQAMGRNAEGEKWKIGIRNPFEPSEIVKIVYLSGQGIATSGNYMRGKHIIDPIHQERADEISSMTVIASNVYEADRFATATFAMGEKGINFLEKTEGLEGYMIGKDKIAKMTSGFDKYLMEGNK